MKSLRFLIIEYDDNFFLNKIFFLECINIVISVWKDYIVRGKSKCFYRLIITIEVEYSKTIREFKYYITTVFKLLIENEKYSMLDLYFEAKKSPHYYMYLFPKWKKLNYFRDLFRM